MNLAKKAAGQNLHGPIAGKGMVPPKSDTSLKKAILSTLSNFSTSPRANAHATKKAKKSFGAVELDLKTLMAKK